MNFSVNQVRQVYVADAVPEIKKMEKEGYFYYTLDGGKTKTDIIEGSKAIIYTSVVGENQLKPQVATYAVSLDPTLNGGSIIPGQEYTLTVFYRNFSALGDAVQKFVKGYVKATPGMTNAKFYKAMANSINDCVKNEPRKILEATATDSGVILKEVTKDWTLGIGDHTRVFMFEVYGDQVVLNNVEYSWANIEKTVAVDTTYPSGRVVADLEYFAHGERGDQYRKFGWPYVIETEYKVDPTKEYNVLTIHFAHNAASSNLASEKDIQFILPVSLGDNVSVANDGTISVVSEEQH